MKTIICLLLLTALVAACGPGPDGIASTDSSFKTVVPKTPFVNAEKYVGTLPCDDCEGIDVSLQLNRNKTYILNAVYRYTSADSSSNSTKDTGSWSQGNDTIYLRSGRTEVGKYIKTGTALIKLDDDGNRITGPLANMYILHKK
jgi:uncharacterized lipoprotein NlpE involved in copper resistance